MRFEKPLIQALLNESDVEQKFLYNLITGDFPEGLGHDSADVFTKRNIKKMAIGKGTEKKTYFPDYIIARAGIPLVVAEAKQRGADLNEAFREARLYAGEINALYPSGLQPVAKVFATNGDEVWAGMSDQAEPIIKLSYDEVAIYSEKFGSFTDVFGFKSVDEDLSRILPKIRPAKFYKPRKLVGGSARQREEIGMNTFGATISADFSRIFNPLSMEDRSFIVKNGYISSKRRERYVEPIDRVIRASTPLAESRSITLDDTEKPTEIIKKFRTHRDLEHQVLLIVGSAGAGKTTFVDHLREVALPSDIRSKTVWLHLNMNPAPISREEIYSWLREEIILKCRSQMPGTDFDELSSLKAVHNASLNQFRKGVGRLYEKDQAVYNQKLAEHLETIIANRHLVAQNHASFLSTSREQLLVIVFDNCDKRLRDEQLLMFEAAQWIQREFRALVVLPIREETYDNHQGEAPLDTAIKDLVFRIEPPQFQKILQSRVQLAMRSVQERGLKTLRYELPNGMHVDYPASDQGHYLSSILRSVFEHEMKVRRLIVGLAGRNMRRAMEIFLEFCTSGYISEEHITKMIQSQGQYALPLSLVSTVLLRSNLRFYDSQRSYLRNVFSASEKDERPSFFSRLLILRVLDEKSEEFGPKRLKGYARAGAIRAELAKFGVEETVYFRDLEALTKSFCVLSEDFRSTGLTDDDLIALAPAGRVHLQISSDVYYLAAIAEDTWFQNEDAAQEIVDRIKYPDSQISPDTILYNAKAVLSELETYRRVETAAYDAVFRDQRFSQLVDLTRAESIVRKYESSLVSAPWVNAKERFPSGKTHAGTVVKNRPFGVLVEIEPGLSGIIKPPYLASVKVDQTLLKIGSTIDVVIGAINSVKKKMELTLCDPSSFQAMK